jgi:hypothetical protein
MATALAHATVAAAFLAGMADFIATDWAKAAMGSACTLPTCPTKTATGVTVPSAAHRTGNHPTCIAEDLLTITTLLQAGITDQMSVAIEDDLGHFRIADMAARAL